MKHLIHKKHHPHLKKRLLLEIFGFIVLLLFSISQWEVLSEALRTVSKIEAWWFIVLLGLFWILLPLTAINYKLISPKPKKIDIATTSLAHLAGAGPGRIIPGGIGNLSIGAMHLKKSGLTIEQGVSVVATNNIIGLITTLGLVVTALIVRPETVRIISSSLTSQQLIVLALACIALLVLFQWLLHARRTRREIIKTSHSWKKIITRLTSSPVRISAVFVVSLLILLAHTTILHFSGIALDVDMHFIDALIALSFGVAIGIIIPTPGGVGGVEAGIVATFIAIGYDFATATSIAVLFRIVTYWQPLLPGTLSYLYLREKNLL
jgi:uncharacterized protein (TIRG00374 family)